VILSFDAEGFFAAMHLFGGFTENEQSPSDDTVGAKQSHYQLQIRSRQ
jgi:hypothetical protein